jgi:hypothetical protein
MVPNSYKNSGMIVKSLKPQNERKESLVSNLLFEIFDVLISNCKGRTFRIFDDMFKDLDVDGTGFIDLEYLNNKLRELKFDNEFQRMNSEEEFEGKKISYTEFLVSCVDFKTDIRPDGIKKVFELLAGNSRYPYST